jgi:hypothetical protein
LFSSTDRKVLSSSNHPCQKLHTIALHAIVFFMERLGLPSSPEGPIPVSELARAELSERLASAEAIRLHGAAAELISGDETLLRLLAIKIEGGPELDPEAKAHLSRMIAIRSGGIFDRIVGTEQEAVFWGSVGEDVRATLGELADLEDELSGFPDLWSMAAEDLGKL